MYNAIQLITPREKEVLCLLAKGMTYRKMALRLDVSAETVKKHLKNIYRKLKFSNKIKALHKAKII